ncbi:mitochondrial outer membrane protein SLC25A46 [Hyalella azteca]|uniref:Mitochondrial outer membrane protein SLC25A46 n=1 Tax=Hyalella azteca TaxID=294128 RepID=A0A979FMI3_HYAAZ|nr:mitochondrial outer membrane protein SLC25A46 [Hyalella azteca]
MAGLDDYQFYATLRDHNNPFWKRADSNPDLMTSDMSDGPDLPYQPKFENETRYPRPSDLPERLPSTPKSPRDRGEAIAGRYAELSISIVSLMGENLLSHPFTVLRRVCQVDVSSKRQHLLPITILYASMKSQQGITVLWKGLGSVLIVKGLTMGVEDVISKFTPLPKDVYAGSSVRTVSQHLLLKCLSLAVVTPFLAASLVETVQSSVACESPGIFDVFKEGLTRLLSFTQPQIGRLLPIWLVVVPTVTHGLLHYIIGNAASTLAQHACHAQYLQKQGATARREGAVAKNYVSGSFNDTSTRLHAAFFGHLVADVLLYPMETLVHRLQLQGTRTIIDSLDAGYDVRPVLTRYEGFWDCLSTTIRDEGPLGLMKGFGAVCLQYAVYGAVLNSLDSVLRAGVRCSVPAVCSVRCCAQVRPRHREGSKPRLRGTVGRRCA